MSLVHVPTETLLETDCLSPESPDGLVAEPAGVTLVEPFLKGCLELEGGPDHGPDVPAGLLSPREGQGVAAGDGSVVEEDA